LVPKITSFFLWREGTECRMNPASRSCCLVILRLRAVCLIRSKSGFGCSDDADPNFTCSNYSGFYSQLPVSFALNLELVSIYIASFIRPAQCTYLCAYFRGGRGDLSRETPQCTFFSSVSARTSRDRYYKEGAFHRKSEKSSLIIQRSPARWGELRIVEK